MRLNCTHPFLVCADDVNILIGRKSTYCKGKHNALAVAGNEISLEVYVAKAKYMVMSRDQNAGQNHNINIDNKIL